jgi:hypothetical protein
MKNREKFQLSGLALRENDFPSWQALALLLDMKFDVVLE